MAKVVLRGCGLLGFGFNFAVGIINIVILMSGTKDLLNIAGILHCVQNDKTMNGDTIKKYIPFIIIVIVAVAVGFFIGGWWVKRTFVPSPAAGSGTRVLSSREVQQALPSFTAPQRGGSSPQPISKKVLDSFTAPSR